MCARCRGLLGLYSGCTCCHRTAPRGRHLTTSNSGQWNNPHIPTHKKLYAYTVFCEITFLRKNGMRLREAEWLAPVCADLIFGDHEARSNSFRRHLRCATLYERYGGQAWRTVAMLADPVILRSVGDGWLIAGIEIHAQEGRAHEYSQLWLCRPTQPGAQPLKPLDYKRELENVLPSC